MAKRKKSNVGMMLSGLSVLLGLAAIIMLFLPAVAVKDTDTTYTGLQVTFGYSVDIPILGEAEIFKFSFMNLLAYILAAAGVVFAILSAMGKSGKFASFIAAAAWFMVTVSCIAIRSKRNPSMWYSLTQYFTEFTMKLRICGRSLAVSFPQAEASEYVPSGRWR